MEAVVKVELLEVGSWGFFKAWVLTGVVCTVGAFWGADLFWGGIDRGSVRFGRLRGFFGEVRWDLSKSWVRRVCLWHLETITARGGIVVGINSCISSFGGHVVRHGKAIRLEDGLWAHIHDVNVCSNKRMNLQLIFSRKEDFVGQRWISQNTYTTVHKYMWVRSLALHLPIWLS